MASGRFGHWSCSEEIGAAVAEGGKGGAPGGGGVRGKGGAQEGGGGPGFGEDFTLRTDQGTGSGIGKVGIGATTVKAEDKCLIFNGPGTEENGLVLLAEVRPIGNDAEEIGSGGGGGAEQFRKAEVVADDRGDGESVPREGDDFPAGREGPGFAGGGEGMDFPVAGEEVAMRGKGAGFVRAGAVGELPGEAAEDVNLVGTGQSGEEDFRFGGGGVSGAGDVHAEAAGKHFREHEERSGSEAGGGGGECRLHGGKVGGAILPDEVELEGTEFHEGLNPYRNYSNNCKCKLSKLQEIG